MKKRQTRVIWIATILFAVAVAACGQVAPESHNADAALGSRACVLDTNALDDGCTLTP